MISSVTARSNHYEALGLRPTATADEVAQAYAAQMATFRLHPEGALKRLARLSTAYETLRDPGKRHAYDASLRVDAQAATPAFLGAASAAPKSFTPPPPTAAPSRPQSKPPTQPRADAAPRVGSFIAASLREPVRPTESEIERTQAPQARVAAEAVAPKLQPADLYDALAVETGETGINRRHAAIGAGVIGLAALAIAVSLPVRNVDRLPTASPGEKAENAVTVGLPPAKPVEDAELAAAAPNQEAPASHEQPAIESAPQPVAEAQAVTADDPQPAADAVQQVTPEAAASATQQPSAGPAPDQQALAVATESAPVPVAPAAKLPLSNATVASTIERIGYACGSVASTAPLDGAGAGVFKVTCSSGDSYQATPVQGRYHFRRLSNH